MNEVEMPRHGWVISAVAAVLIVGDLEYLGLRAGGDRCDDHRAGHVAAHRREQHLPTGMSGRYVFAGGAVGGPITRRWATLVTWPVNWFGGSLSGL